MSQENIDNNDQEEQPSLNDLEEILLNSREMCEMTQQVINNQIRVKDERIDRLHEELTMYKKLVDDKYTAELMKELIKVRKNMMRVLESDDWETKTAEELRKEYTYIFEDVSDLLEQNNVDEIKSQPGDAFDAAFMNAKVEQTDDPEKDKVIIESIQPGYKKGDKVLIPEKVKVYKYVK